MFFDQRDRHEQMARLDPRDTNMDGMVSPQEAAAYIQEYMQNASPQERQQLMQEYFQQLPPDQRQQMGDAMVQSPYSPVQNVRYDDPNDLADAYTRTAQAPMQDGRSPLEAAFGQGGALGNPLVKAGLVGLAGMIGSRLLRR
ncbi:hypothetical protein DAETH_01980 [Deinococcus aetherius]|uniref:EF-hand domain-containing protein n=1 Tax=Deinococcus aetherius TaxID=200252 RepID=A0ABM8A903_9DEIO|nr:hypothetical protein [Deinococcus aetherius]BDP40229.1 hypothetical protein DAETH_01980 [Deinococcus aetherius]